MLHYLSGIAGNGATVVLAAVVGYFGRAINKRLGEYVDLPAAVSKLADAVAQGEAFRVDVTAHLTDHDRKLVQHDRQLANAHQRITVLETRKEGTRP